MDTLDDGLSFKQFLPSETTFILQKEVFMRKALYSISISFLVLFLSVPALSADADADAGDTSADVVDTVDADVDTKEGSEDTSGHHTAPDVEAPDSVGETVDLVEESLSLADKGAWLAFAVVLIQILMFIIKRLKSTKWVVKRHGTAIVLSLSAVASVLTLVVQGSGVLNAVVVFVVSSGSKFVHDLLHVLNVIEHREDKNKKDGEE